MVNNNITFLDLNIYVDTELNINLTPYYKPTSTGKFISAKSFHPINQKTSCYFTLFHKLFSLNLNHSILNVEIEKIIKFGLNSGHNRVLLNQILKKATYSHKHKLSTSLKKFKNDNGFISLHWAKELSGLNTKNLNEDRTIAFKPPPSIGRTLQSRLKDKIPGDMKPGIYVLPCGGQG